MKQQIICQGDDLDIKFDILKKNQIIRYII